MTTKTIEAEAFTDGDLSAFTVTVQNFTLRPCTETAEACNRTRAKLEARLVTQSRDSDLEHRVGALEVRVAQLECEPSVQARIDAASARALNAEVEVKELRERLAKHDAPDNDVHRCAVVDDNDVHRCAVVDEDGDRCFKRSGHDGDHDFLPF